LRRKTVTTDHRDDQQERHRCLGEAEIGGIAGDEQRGKQAGDDQNAANDATHARLRQSVARPASAAGAMMTVFCSVARRMSLT
jgi:hypothetical protein